MRDMGEIWNIINSKYSVLVYNFEFLLIVYFQMIYFCYITIREGRCKHGVLLILCGAFTVHRFKVMVVCRHT